MFSDFNIDTSSTIPIYIQLADYLRNNILLGVYKDGMKFPGRAILTKVFNVSKGTLSSAFDVLQQEEFVKSIPRQGYIVTYSTNTDGVNWNKYIKRAKHKVATEEYTSYIGSIREFALHRSCDLSSHLQYAFIKTAENFNFNCQYHNCSKHGCEPLRYSLKKHLEKSGIFVDTDNIFITSEPISRLYHLYESLMTVGSTLMTEKHNIINTISNIHSLGLNIVPIESELNGISMPDLKKKISMYPNMILHIDPTDTSPTGMVISQKHRKEILSLSQMYKFPVVEM